MNSKTISEQMYEQSVLYLNQANEYAQAHSTCTKTATGCHIYHNGVLIGQGANSGDENCKEMGCLRIALFGSNSKEHRATCRCRHAEINALRSVADYNRKYLPQSIAVVTRYPCYDCATALVNAGIKVVVYGRPFHVANATMELFEKHGVKVLHIEDWNCDLSDTNA